MVSSLSRQAGGGGWGEHGGNSWGPSAWAGPSIPATAAPTGLPAARAGSATLVTNTSVGRTRGHRVPKGSSRRLLPQP